MQSIANVESDVMASELGDSILAGCEELSTENLKVVNMLFEGYKQVEIAKELGISKPAVSQRIKTIANVLKGFVQD
jgi:DNA-directed RNA polymerase specialized sigma subunit